VYFEYQSSKAALVMIMADVLTWFLLIVGTILVLNSYWLAAVSLWPTWVDTCAARYRQPVKTTLAGVVAAIPCVIVVMLLRNSHHPVGNAVSIIAIGVLLVAGMAGSAGLAQRIGQGLVSPKDEGQPWRRVLRGGIVFAFTMLLPFVGWFVVLPWALVSGLGAVTLAWSSSRRVRRQTATASPANTAHDSASPLVESSGMSSTQNK
jgi:hypothetical protein